MAEVETLTSSLAALTRHPMFRVLGVAWVEEWLRSSEIQPFQAM
jgi:hypothetical protein